MEERYVVKMLGTDERDREVLTWAKGVAGHWERKRRAEVLEVARAIILTEEEGGRVSVELEVEVDVVPVGSEKSDDVAMNLEAEVGIGEEDDAWGLEGEPAQDEPEEMKGGGEDGDGWGLDEDESAEPEQTPVASPLPPPREVEDTEDAGDAWGWNDDEEGLVGDDGTDSAPTEHKTNGNGYHNGDVPHEPPFDEPEPDADPWDDDPWAESTSSPSSPIAPISAPPPPPHVPAPISIVPAKRATRLEKLANKAKGNHQTNPSQSSNGSEPPPQTPSSVASAAFVPAPPSTPVKSTRKVETNRPQKISVPVKSTSAPEVQVVVPQKEKETYMISARARSLATTAQSILSEGHLFSISDLFNGDALSGLFCSEDRQKRGAVLGQSAPSMLDLWRALYPVRFKKELDAGRDRGMVFANDCAYLGSCAKRLFKEGGKGDEFEREKLMEAAERLTILGDSWFEDTVVSLCSFHYLSFRCSEVCSIRKDKGRVLRTVWLRQMDLSRLETKNGLTSAKPQ